MKYTDQEKTEIINFYNTHTIKETKEKYNVAYTTIKCWLDPQFREKQLEFLKQDYIKNGARVDRVKYRKENNKKKYNENKEYYKKINHEQYIKNKTSHQTRVKDYYKNNKTKVNNATKKYRKERYKIDEMFRIKSALRCRINQAFRDQHANKVTTTHDLLGCTIPECKSYIESQFKEGMNWDNYGKWHIDHIKPCSLFDLTNLEEQKKCFNYTNLQPLWADENLQKSDIYKPSLCIINCAATKKKHACIASQMYDDSKLFRTARDYAQTNFDQYVILSAKYGVLDPDQIIEPYEDTVMFVSNNLLHSGKPYKSLSAKEKKEWAKDIRNNINPEDYSSITFLIGGYYWEYLAPHYKDIDNINKLDMPSGVTPAIKYIENLS